MAGASALQQVLLEHSKAKLKVLAVWEPVLGLAIAPPSSSNLARLSDPRVEQFWDSGQLLSQRLLAIARAHPERLGPNQREQLTKAQTVWDFIALFPSSAHWAGEPPFPEFSGAPVVDVMDEVRSRIRAADTGPKK
ncbi:MAG: hypothetical protein DME19_18125 [Verrucomicrobia bacterium]|nr:MAG: hypothetical protein DME19_18125 [Verrucomicrobiota bacterium]